MIKTQISRDHTALMTKRALFGACERKDGEPSLSAVKETIDSVARTFEEFKKKNDQELEEIKKKGAADVVTVEEVKRINTQITELSQKYRDLQTKMQRPAAGGGNGEINEAKAAHRQAFDTYFRKGRGDSDLRELEAKAFTGQSNPDGGFLVPTEMSSEIDRVLGTVSVMRSLATVIAIGTGAYKKLVNVGGAASGWVGETEARPATATPTLEELVFNTMELYANPAATQTVLDDATLDLATWLANEVNVEFAEQEGAAFITGSGVNRPRGLLSYTKVANASYAWGKVGYVATGASGAFVAAANGPGDCLIELIHALKSGYRNGATFLMSDLTCAAVRKLKDTEGNYLWRPGLTEDKVDTLLGKPVAYDDNMPAMASDSFSIAFGNFKRAYLIIDRAGVQVLRDPYSNKPYVHFYTTKRVGGGIQNYEAVKLLKFATS